jgi:hypothetical protein
MLTEVAKRDAEVWVPGDWVRAAARAAGEKSQQDLADLAKAHRTTTYRWMRRDEKGGVDYITWRGILSVLGLPADWQPPPSASTTDPQ